MSSPIVAVSIVLAAASTVVGQFRTAVVGQPEVGRRQAGDRAPIIGDQRLDADDVDGGAELARDGGGRGQDDRHRDDRA